MDETDRKAMDLREAGHSFAGIAKTLGLERASDARAAFLRDLGGRVGKERKALTDRELERLDKLEVRVRARDAEDPEKLDRELKTLAAMRKRVNGLGVKKAKPSGNGKP